MSCFSKVTQRKLEVIAADVAIIGRRLFQLASELPEMVSSQVTSYPNESLANDLVSSLTNALYLKYYCGCRSPMSRDVSRTDLLTGLRNANASLDGWDDGWKIIDRNTEGQVVVRSGARTRLIALEDASVLGPSDSGDARLSIRRRREDFESQPGYYYAIGDAIGDQYEDQVGARIYLNLKVEAAETWMWRVTTELNRYRLPFQFKVLRHSASFVRIDSGIIYVPRRHAGFAASLIADLALVVGGLGDRTPLFTRRVAGGIALADNPPGGASFGLSRMRLVAEGHIDAWSDQSSDVRSRVKAIASRFRRAGVDPLRPWLNPGDNTDVILQPAVPRARARTDTGTTSWLDVADRIGARLVRDAIWHRDRCTWLGWALMPESAGYKPALCTAGGDLYSGTAGVAIFLARLSAATQDDRQRATAIGALRHAIDLASDPYWRVGAYSGLSGVLHAAIAVADADGQIDTAAAAVPLLIEKLSVCKPPKTDVDVLDGRAGAIRSLLHSVNKWDPRGLGAATAVRFGRDIIELAHRRDDKWSWETTKTTTLGHLLGYSHGTSGIACALNDLFHLTGDEDFKLAAEAAWRYEISLFDRARLNWPDFREPASSVTDKQARADRFETAWCHGAPGTALALARHIARQSESSAELDALLSASVETTTASISVKATPEQEAASFCLCHGIAGNADILLEIAHLTGRTDLKPLVIQAARTGAKLYHQSGNWPCGVPGGDDTPALMLGLSGIGHFYLRLHDASVPSPLSL